MDIHGLDIAIKAYLGDNLITSYPAFDFGRGGYVYIFKINNNAYRVFCDSKYDEMIFQVLAVAFYDDEGNECYDDACDYKSVSGNMDSWFDLFKQWIDECEADDPNFTKFEEPIMSSSIYKEPHIPLDLDSIIARFENYLSRQDYVEDFSFDIDGPYLCITIVFTNGEVIDAWDEEIAGLPEEVDVAVNYLIDKFEAIDDSMRYPEL